MSVKFLLFIPFPMYFLFSLQMTEKDNRTKLNQETIQILIELKLGSDQTCTKRF